MCLTFDKNEYMREWREKNPERQREIWRDSYHRNKHKYKEKRREYHKKYHEKLRLLCLIHYGGDPPRCACCGETIVEFLTIDHIDGDGNKHRKKVGGGVAFFGWLKRNSFPEGYQVLCYNCNCAKGHYGECPHEKSSP